MNRLDWSSIAVPAIFMALGMLVIVMLHSGLRGENGLAALHDANELEQKLARELADLTGQHAEVENRVQRLRAETLDLDLLDERARAILGYVRPDEKLVR